MEGVRPSLAGIAAWIVLAACSLTAVDQDIDVLLPAPPGHWQVAFQGLGFLVSAREASGRQTQVTFIGWESAARVRCARSVNAPILAWPFTPGLEPGTLRPAGGFFALTARHGRSGDAVELTWENGAAALVVDRVAAAGRDVSRFNVERLCTYMAREGDPWRLDLDSIAQKIAQGELTT